MNPTFNNDGDDKMADLCLRAIRSGARSGVAGGVKVASERSITDQGRSLAQTFWSIRYPGVQPTGSSAHWTPLPGVQVLVSAHNAAKWIMGSIGSIERSMEGFRWTLIITDDGSTDNTAELCADHNSQADRYIFQSYPKAANVDEAKNRTVRLALKYRREYPVIALMDADDEMRASRVRYLLWQMRDANQLAVVGDYQRYDISRPEHVIHMVRANETSQARFDFGPWATLFHAKLIPEDGNLFWSNPYALGDCDLWLRWFVQGIKIVPVSGEVVHIYYIHGAKSTTHKIQQRYGPARKLFWMKRKMELVNQLDDT